MKTASFTVRATVEQSARWKRAAAGESHTSVGTWLAEAADRYLDGLKRSGRPVPLGWRRCLSFSFQAPGRGAIVVPGSVSHPFGYFRGTDAGADRHSNFFTLVYLPDGRIIATLRTAAQCRTLGADLARLWVKWGGEQPAEDPAPVLHRFQREDV